MAKTLSLISLPNMTVKNTELTNNSLLFVLSNLLFDSTNSANILKNNIVICRKKNKNKKIKRDFNIFRKRIEVIFVMSKKFYKHMKKFEWKFIEEVLSQYEKRKGSVELSVEDFHDDEIKKHFDEFFAQKNINMQKIDVEEIRPLMHNRFRPIIYIGLRNMGNTCYMNSALQLLFNCDILANIFLSGLYNTLFLNKHRISKECMTISYEFNNFLNFACKKINLSHENYANLDNDIFTITPSNLRIAFINKYKYFNNNEEHDSIEFLCCIIDSLYEEMKIPILNKKTDEFSVKKIEKIIKKFYLKNNWAISKEKMLIATNDHIINRQRLINKNITEKMKTKKYSILEKIFYSHIKIENLCINEICGNKGQSIQTYNNITLPILKEKKKGDILTINIFLPKNGRNFSVEIPRDNFDLNTFFTSYFNLHNYVFFLRYSFAEKMQIFLIENNNLNMVFEQIKKNNIDINKSTNSILSFILNKKEEITDDNVLLNIFQFEKDIFMRFINLFKENYAHNKELIMQKINFNRLPFIFIRIKYHRYYLFQKNIRYPIIFYNDEYDFDDIENNDHFKFTLAFQQKIENFLCKYFNRNEFSCKYLRKTTELYISNDKIFFPLLEVEVENSKNSSENLIRNKFIFQKEKRENLLEIFMQKTSGHLSLGDLLNNYFQPTYAECIRCKNNSLRQNMSILQLPLYLILSINRFEYLNNSVNKINTFIDIPKYLLIEKQFYRLTAAINHIQNTTYAHYTVYVYKDGRWWLFNDSLYSSVEKIDKSNIYCCLYEKIDFYN